MVRAVVAAMRNRGVEVLHDPTDELVAALPGISINLLTERLRSLGDADVIERTPTPTSRSSTYGLTDAGRALTPILDELGSWASRCLPEC